MTKPDNPLHFFIFGEVKEMDMHIEDICIDLKHDTKFFDDEIEFLKQNYDS
jgi:hypothetical protein